MAKFKKGDKVKVKSGHEDECPHYERVYESINDDQRSKLYLVIMGIDEYDEYGYKIMHEDNEVLSVNEGGFDDDDLEYIVGSRKSKAKKNKNLIQTVVLDPEKKEEIMAAIAQIEHNERIFEEWGFDEIFEKGTAIAMLFYGKPGTGKTLMAEAVANHLGRKLRILQTAEIESSEPGGAERAIKSYFEAAETNNEVLLFDECDSLIFNRDAVGAILAAQVNAVLSALEQFRGVVIFTTNRLGKLDPAFERRVSAKVHFPFPRQDVRERIWKRMIPKKAPISKDVDFAKLARFPIAGGNIKNVVLNAARHAAYKEMDEINIECFTVAMKKEVEGMEGFSKAFKNLEGGSYKVEDKSRDGGSVGRKRDIIQEKEKANS